MGQKQKSDNGRTGVAQARLPADRAKPAEVQEWLRKTLVSALELSDEHATRIAACWKLGTGRELRVYPPAMFRHLFGLEEGWIVYKQVRLSAVQERPKYYDTAGFYVLVAGFAISAILGTAASVGDLSHDARLSCWLIAGVIGFFVVFFTFLSILPDDGDDAWIETHLRKHYWTAVDSNR